MQEVLQKSIICVLPQSALCIYFFVSLHVVAGMTLPNKKWGLHIKVGGYRQ